MAEWQTQLEKLQRLDLIVLKKSEPEQEYAFKHVFTQESVYSSLLRSERRRLHQEIGLALEESEAAGSEENNDALMLAYHFEQGGDQKRALKYLRQAAAEASAAYANQEANALYRRALALLEAGDYPRRWEIMANQEQILDRLGEREAQADLLVQMQTLADLLEDKRTLATTHIRRAAYFDKISEYQAAAKAAELALQVARQTEDEHLQAQSLNYLALAAWRRFDYRAVQRWATEALEALKVVGDPRIRIVSLFHLGKASYRLGQYDRALRYTWATQALTRNTDNRDGEATSYLILAWIYQRLGDYPRAVENLEAKLNLRRTIGDRYGEATALSHLGWVAYDQGDAEAGLNYCRQALDISREISDRENEAYALSGMALNYEQLEQLEQAETNYQAALALHDEIGASTLSIFDQAGLARIALARQDLEAARSYIKGVADWVLAGNAQKFWDPWIIYQTGHQVLAALAESETAYTILREAHTVLHERAEEISDEELRHCFLCKVTVNQQIEDAWQREQAARA